MTDQVSDLLGTVREEILLYRELVEHARRKTSLLAQGGLEAILDSNKTDEALNARLRMLAQQMTRLCSDLGRIFRIRREEVTLMKLADRLEPSFALELRALAVVFRDLAKQLKSISRNNARFMETSLRYSRGLLTLLGNASGAYQPSGTFERLPAVHSTFSRQA